jgi:hypothetical protein
MNFYAVARFFFVSFLLPAQKESKKNNRSICSSKPGQSRNCAK